MENVSEEVIDALKIWFERLFDLCEEDGLGLARLHSVCLVLYH